MYVKSLTRSSGVTESSKSIFINVESASIFWGYEFVELGVLIPSQVFCYVDLLRQYDDNVSVLEVIRIKWPPDYVNESYRLLIEDF